MLAKMAKLNDKPIWVVRNPSRISGLQDIFFATTVDGLFQYRLGICAINSRPGEDIWNEEKHTVYDDEEEARIDAFSRLKDVRDSNGSGVRKLPTPPLASSKLESGSSG